VLGKFEQTIYPMKRLIFFTLFCLIFFNSAQVIPGSEDDKNQKIISLTPATTEILFSLGLDDEIKGVTTFCNFPDKALSKNKVGTFSQPDIEKILYLKPDIIFATGLEQAPAVARLRQLKLKVCVSDPSNTQELFASIKEIGKLTGRGKEALDLINQMKTEISQIKAKVKSIPNNKRPKVFIEIWHDPLMTAARGSYIDELINLAGGINIAHDAPLAYSYFSPEQVIKRNPDCIILGYMAKEKAQDIIKDRLGWANIKAVKNNRIYNDINPDLFLRPGPRLVKGLREIHRRLYPK